MIVVFLVDVDNTLLDNDRVTADLKRHLEHGLGHDREERYWAIFEELRAELGYGDYLGALQRYRLECPRDTHVLTVSSFLIDYPFASRLYPKALDVLAAIKQVWGSRVTTVFARQGHHAHDPTALAAYPPADVSVERIGDLLGCDLPRLLAPAASAP